MYTLVTGATSDIGRVICQTLTEAGHTLLLTDLSEDALKDVCQSLSGANHRYLALDFTDVEKAQNDFKEYIVCEQLPVSNAVFAAGIFATKPIKMVDYAFIKKNFDVALFSIIELTQVLANKRINGTNLQGVVMVSSVSAKFGTKGYAIYSAVKSAMLGLVHSLAAELAPVRVNAVLPGGIHTKTTDFIYQANPEIDRRYVLGEGKPEDVANAVAFLLSDKSRWITGQEMVVDGGWSRN
ncbi:MAG: SDR family oxidoreductase [Paludibacteraceae bacterium]|nr:SDR family oxidoreductase [Paludibacteraceae bacterium]